MKIRLRQREKHDANASKADGVPHVSGLCLKCAQHEAVLAGTHTNLHVQAIDRLSKSVVIQAQMHGPQTLSTDQSKLSHSRSTHHTLHTVDCTVVL